MIKRINRNKLKLVFNKDKTDSEIRFNNISIGGSQLAIIAGPCSVESKEQVITIAKFLKRYGVKIVRGGAFKPRTYPYDFQGLFEEGLEILAETKKETGLLTVTEVLTPEDIELVDSYVDIIQVGARNMYNYSLLKQLGKIEKPIILKRAFSANIDEWLGAAEYILCGGNQKIIFCERGIRTFNNSLRFTLDLATVSYLKQLIKWPIIVDPSHGTGNRQLVSPMAKASIASGADGLLIEVHNKPSKAKCDGHQSLRFNDFKELVNNLMPIAEAVGKTI